ncbi:MAG: TRAP transporter small permease subunit, partial [Gammaproteobacteria bacterium]
VVDHAMLWPEAAKTFKISEVAPYMLKADIGAMNSKTVTVNSDVWQKLPDEVKTVLRDVAVAYRDHVAEQAMSRAADSLAAFEAAGGTVVEMSAQERAAWATSMRKARPALRCCAPTSLNSRRPAARPCATGQTSCNEPASTLAMIDAWLHGLQSALTRAAIIANAIGSIVVLGLVAVVNFDVVARGAFNAPFRGAVEVVQFSLVLIVFAQLPDVVRVGRLTRSDGLLTVLGSRAPRIAAMLHRAIDTLSALLMVLIAITMWPEVVETFESKDYFGTPGVFTAPWWPVKLAIFTSAALCTALFVLRAVHGPAAGPTTGRA